MATDAKFDKIQKIISHDNADALEIALVSNFPCVVRKGEFKEGDWCFYIRDDAKLLGYDELKEYETLNKDSMNTSDFVEHDVFTCSFQWQTNLLKYLGGGGRVKSIKLRGKVSMGILLKPNVVCPNIIEFADDIAEYFNTQICNPVTGNAYLEKNFGVSHWVAPSTGFGSLNVKYAGLPFSMSKTDQENWENVDEADLHIGSECVITKKLDGTSTTITCYPDGKYDISSRGQTFNIDDMIAKGEENVYTKYTKGAVKAGCWYAKKFGKTIALRGETCCRSVQNSSYNKDCQLEDFFLYGCEFPEECNYFMKHGVYGTDNHFIKIAEIMNANGFNIKTVPIIGYGKVSRELLISYNDREWNWGEGIVINVKCDDIGKLDSFVWSYKSKSREYLMKMK